MNPKLNLAPQLVVMAAAVSPMGSMEEHNGM